jgi:hypothetical protein
MSAPHLVPCPLCGRPPNRFEAGEARIKVIACVRGCKPSWNKPVVHIRDCDLEIFGSPDIHLAWNTIRCGIDEAGNTEVWFDIGALSGVARPFLPEGPYMDWSTEISAMMIRRRLKAGLGLK